MMLQLKQLERQKKKLFDCREQYLKAAVYAPWKGLPKGPYPCAPGPVDPQPKSSRKDCSDPAVIDTEHKPNR